MVNCFQLTKRILLFIVLSGYGMTGSGADRVCVSILTVDPGEEIYSVFGHTAIRIIDDSAGTDKVYNFGTFNFEDPWFYLKFMKGNLDYFLSVSSFDTFIANTCQEGRRTYEQVLDLSPDETRYFSRLLDNTWQSAERYYRYDFFYDNCATRVRDYIGRIRDYRLDTAQYCCKSFRQLLLPYIKDRYWLHLGIDLALGKNADTAASASDYMFLPVYIKNILDESDLVVSENILLQGTLHKHHNCHKWWPWLILSVIVLSQFTKLRKYAMLMLLLLVASAGVILGILTLISENQALTGNWNILWTIPALVILVFPGLRVKKILKIIYLVELMVILVCRNHYPQELSHTFTPWMAGLAIVLAADSLNKKIPQWRYSIITFLKK